MRPIAPLTALIRVEQFAAETLLEFLGIGEVSEAPLAFVVDSVPSAAEREVLAELVNLPVAAAPAGARP